MTPSSHPRAPADDRVSLYASGVQDERPAPRVSISDPSTPSGYGDVLRSGADRPPWRPNRRQLRVLLAVLLVLLVAVPPTLWFKHRSDERTADRQALASVSIVLAEEGDPVLFRFRNTGPAAVTVLSAQLERAGSPPIEVGRQVAAGGYLELTVSFDGPCPTVLSRNGPPGIVLAVRTSRGGQREVPVDLRDTVTSLRFLDQIRQTCQLFEPEDSIEVGSSTLDLQGRSLVVTVGLNNRSVLPRRLTFLGAGPGLVVTATPALPLTIAAAVRGEQAQGATATLTARVTVADCAVVRERLAATDDVHGGREFGGLTVAYNGASGDHLPVLYLGDSYEQLLRDLVAASC